MFVNVNIHAAFKEYLGKKFPDKTLNEEVYEYFFKSGVVDEVSALRILVKSRYYDLLKGNNSARSARLDCAVEFGVSETFVSDVVYKYKKIKP